MDSKRSQNKGKNLVYLRSSNQGGAIRTLVYNGRVSRQELAVELQLTKMSITYIVNDLIEKGIVREADSVDETTYSSPGRRPALLELVTDSLFAVGVYISRNHIITSLTDISGNVVDEHKLRLASDTTRYTLTGQAVKSIGEMLGLHQNKKIIGIGVACIGLVDILNGVIVGTTDFFEIRDLNIKDELQKHFKLPVFVANDMKAAALSESFFGVAKGLTDFVYLGVTYGIGSGIVMNSKLFEGVRGFSSEIGHTTLFPNGPRCNCGNYGCLELYTSIPHLLNRTELDSWTEFLERAQRGEQKVCSVLDTFCEDMGTALVNVVNTFDPQMIVIGHEGALIDSDYFDKMQHILDQRCMTRAVKRVRVVKSGISCSNKLLGGASLVFSQLFLGNIPL